MVTNSAEGTGAWFPEPRVDQLCEATGAAETVFSVRGIGVPSSDHCSGWGCPASLHQNYYSPLEGTHLFMICGS